MIFFERKIKSTNLYKGKILDLYVDEVQLEDGQIAQREYVNHSGGAAVLYIKDNKVLLVKQFRYVYNKSIYELPAGKINKNEEPKTAAMREFEEETGYIAEDVEEYQKIYPTPGYTNEVVYIFKVNKATYKNQRLDKDEFLDCIFLPINEVLCLIESGKICDAKTVCAIFKYLKK